MSKINIDDLNEMWEKGYQHGAENRIKEFSEWLIYNKVIEAGVMKELIRDFNGQQLKEQKNDISRKTRISKAFDDLSE